MQKKKIQETAKASCCSVVGLKKTNKLNLVSLIKAAEEAKSCFYCCSVLVLIIELKHS